MLSGPCTANLDVGAARTCFGINETDGILASEDVEVRRYVLTRRSGPLLVPQGLTLGLILKIITLFERHVIYVQNNYPFHDLPD